jgi:hypothetical protein
MTNLSPPDESYNESLPDHRWHNDFTWEQLPDWIKKNSKYANRLWKGEDVVGKNVRYRISHGKLSRKLRDHITPAQQRRARVMPNRNNNVPMNMTPQTKKGTGLGGILTGREEATSLRNKYQPELDNANAALINEVHHVEREARRLTLDYYNQAQALKADIKTRLTERKVLFDTLDAQIDKERGQEYELFKVKPQGTNITADRLPGEVRIGGLGSVGVVNTAPLKYLERYPAMASTPFIRDIINKIELKEGEIRNKAESYHRAIAGFNKSLPEYKTHVIKCEENLARYRKILKDGTELVNNTRYVKSLLFKMLPQKEKDNILLQTLTHTTEKWERLIEEFKHDLSQWQAQPFTELTYDETPETNR